MSVAHAEELAPSMVAVDLTLSSLPQWLRLIAGFRWRAIDVDELERWTWHTWARIALDHSGLPIVPRTTGRVLVDRHSKRDLNVTMSAADIGARVPCHPDHALRALAVLGDHGWLATTPRPGLASTLTLLCPVENPADVDLTPAPHAGVTPAPRAGPPAPRAGVPRATRGTLGNRGKGELLGDARHEKSDAVPRGADGPIEDDSLRLDWWRQ